MRNLWQTWGHPSNVVHFIELLSIMNRGVVRAEVLRRRFRHSLQSLLSGNVENNPASASKRFIRVAA
jgi:hypothetical protein